jgi:hypothetical protein
LTLTATWLALALLADPTAGHTTEPARTDPHHLTPPPSDAPTSDNTAPQLWPKRPQVVLRAQTPWSKGGKIDRALSEACRNGRFRERTPMLFRAMFTDDVLGVAFGHGLNLRDLDHKGRTDTIYLFRFGDSTACTVLTLPNRDPAAAPPPP